MFVLICFVFWSLTMQTHDSKLLYEILFFYYRRSIYLASGSSQRVKSKEKRVKGWLTAPSCRQPHPHSCIALTFYFADVRLAFTCTPQLTLFLSGIITEKIKYPPFPLQGTTMKLNFRLGRKNKWNELFHLIIIK